MTIPLKRTMFSTKRVMEFFSATELTQLGHSRPITAHWPETTPQSDVHRCANRARITDMRLLQSSTKRSAHVSLAG